MPHERKKHHYVGHTQIVQECIGGEKMSLHIEFQRASKFFDVASFEEKNITACLVARVYIDDPMVGLLAVGYLIHMVREQVRGIKTLLYLLGDSYNSCGSSRW